MDAAPGLLLVPQVTQRHPFRVERMPLISWLDYLAYRRYRRAARRFIGKPARTLLNLAYGLGMGGEGALSFEMAGVAKPLRFNARNLQFNTLYLPHYAWGYEPEIVAVIERALGARDAFYDIGANWGFFSLYLASDPAFEGPIVAFEPFPSTFADLTGLIAQAGLAQRIQCHRIALSDREGSAAMGVPDAMRSGLARLNRNGTGVTVRTARLDDLDLPPPRIIKLDVEEHEAEVLAGGLATIEGHRPLILFESWHDERNLAAIMRPFELLAGLGYRFYLPGWMVENGGVCIPSATALPQGDPADLALVPFEPGQRFILANVHLNVVACHAEQVETLAARLAAPKGRA